MIENCLGQLNSRGTVPLSRSDHLISTEPRVSTVALCLVDRMIILCYCFISLYNSQYCSLQGGVIQHCFVIYKIGHIAIPIRYIINVIRSYIPKIGKIGLKCRKVFIFKKSQGHYFFIFFANIYLLQQFQEQSPKI